MTAVSRMRRGFFPYADNRCAVLQTHGQSEEEIGLHFSRAKRFLSCLSAMVLTAACTLHASAAEGRLYNQYDPYWNTIKFEKYCKEQNTMYISGCGIFSFCNAIYALNSIELDAQEVGAWAVDNGSYRPGNGGLYRDLFYADVEEGWGERAKFTLADTFYGDVTDERLINHLKAGGVAVVHVPYHFMAITGYNEANGMYHIIESACNERRNIPGDSWQTAWKMTNGRTQGTWFALLANTKAPEFAEVTVNRLQSAVGLADFTLNSDIKGDFALGIDNEAGQRISTLYSYNKGYSCCQHVQQNIPEAGMYSCYVTSQNDYGMFSSERVWFEVFDEAPASAAMSILNGTEFTCGDAVELELSGGIATSYQLRVVDRATGELVDTQEETMNFSDEESHTVTWTPDRPGYFTLEASLVNDYGTAETEQYDITVKGSVQVYFSHPDVAGPTGATVSFLETYGGLPILQQEGFSFDGWFTDADGGEQILKDTVVESAVPHTLYAHWTPVVMTTTTTTVQAEPSVLPLHGVYHKGDINMNGSVDVADAVLLARIVAEDDSLQVNEAMLAQADLDSDGFLTVLDLQHLGKMLTRML